MSFRVMRSTMGYVKIFISLISVCVFFCAVSTRAASLAFMSDTMSDHSTSVVSDHEVTFTTPTGVHASGDTIAITFSGFDLSSLTSNDVSLSHGPTTGSEVSETIAGSPSAGTWGVSFSSSQIILSPPTDATTNEITTGDIVRIHVGISAGGSNQMVNPSAVGGYQALIGGGFGDTGAIGLVIVGNDQILVTAEYRGESGGGDGGSGGGGSDLIPPVIANVTASSTSPTSAIVQWVTSEPATSGVFYGQTSSYASGTVSDPAYPYTHVLNLTNLHPCTKYYFGVASTDASGNESVSSGYSFTTVCDNVAPIISNVHVESVTDSQAVILWSTNEPATSRVEFGIGTTYGSSAESVGYTTIHSMPISGLLPNTYYSYRVISGDVSGNVSVSEGWYFVTSHDVTPPTNVLLSATPGDALVVLEWSVPIDTDVAGVLIVRRSDRYPSGPGDGTIVYAGTQTSITDTGLMNGTTYYYGAYVYDHDNNYSSGALASATPQSGLIPPVIPPVVTTSTPPIIPPIIPPTGATSTPPVIPGIPTPGATAGFEFYGANGTLPLSVGDLNVIGARGNAGITVRVPLSSMDGTPRYVVLMVGEFIVQLQYHRSEGWYEGTFSIPANSDITIKGQVFFTDGRIAEKEYLFHGYPNGRVMQSPLFGTGLMEVPNAEVYLYREEGGKWVLWNGTAYGQPNPQMTSENGSYIFEVPVGRYYAEIRKEKYETKRTNQIVINKNIFNERVEIIYIPKSLRELLEASSETSWWNKLRLIARSFAENIVYWSQYARAFLSNAFIQDWNNRIIVPALLIINSINVILSASPLRWLALIQSLFTGFFLWLLRRRYRIRGTVINSLTGRPVDLCSVRLIHSDTDLIVRRAITNKQGRFSFPIRNGEYRIDILQSEYSFPSTLISLDDVGRFGGTPYDGRSMQFTEKQKISLTLPVDFISRQLTYRFIRLKHYLVRIQHGVAFCSLLLSLLTLIVTPSLPVAVLVGAHGILYLVFKRMLTVHPFKRWGFVYDSKTLKPIANAVVRLYDQKHHRLLASQVTGSNGQYGFSVGMNEYAVTVEMSGYEPSGLEHIDVSSEEESLTDTVIGLRKIGSKPVGKGPLVK